MALDTYQSTISLATLYRIKKTGRGVEQLEPQIEIVGGTADIFVSNIEDASPPNAMTVIDGGSALVGTASFAYVPSFIYVVQDTGTTTNIVLTGIEAVVV